MERRQFPTEDEQVAMYRRAIEGAKGKAVTFRTLDVGGDKPLATSACPRNATRCSAGAACGSASTGPTSSTRRCARSCAPAPRHAAHPAADGHDRSEVRACREVLAADPADLRRPACRTIRRIELGVMVEVPVLVEVLPDVLPLVDFVSVGTNDLVQYLLAIDRDNPRVAKMYDPFHPGVLRVLQQIAQMRESPPARAVSICGEIAGDHYFTPLLVGLGYRELSMAPVFLPRVKLMLRSFSLDECRGLADRALRCRLDAGRGAARVQCASTAGALGAVPPLPEFRARSASLASSVAVRPRSCARGLALFAGATRRCDRFGDPRRTHAARSRIGVHELGDDRSCSCAGRSKTSSSANGSRSSRRPCAPGAGTTTSCACSSASVRHAAPRRRRESSPSHARPRIVAAKAAELCLGT
jgi:hypothetical protein